MGGGRSIGKGETYGSESERLGEVPEKLSLQGYGQSQAGGKRAAQPRGEGTASRISQMPGLTSKHFKLFLPEQLIEFLFGKRLKLAEGQVRHGPPRVLHAYKVQNICHLGPPRDNLKNLERLTDPGQ